MKTLTKKSSLPTSSRPGLSVAEIKKRQVVIKKIQKQFAGKLTPSDEFARQKQQEWDTP
jgi:hypothetical protein